jgi:lipid-binding SYLF domain-containing protein
MTSNGTILGGTVGQGIMQSLDNGDSWRKLWREFSEVSSVLWVPRS